MALQNQNTTATPQAQRDIWPNKNLFVISQTPATISGIREMIRSAGWTHSCLDYIEHLTTAKIEDFSMIFIDHMGAYSPFEILLDVRFRKPFVLKPIVVLISETQKSVAPLMEQMFCIKVISKPITISKFSVAFQEVTKLWSTPLYRMMRNIDALIQAGQNIDAIDLLQKSNWSSKEKPLTMLALSMLLEISGAVKDAEALLIGAVKENPKHPGLTFILNRFYQRQNMASYSLKLLEALKKQFSDSPMVDLERAHVLAQTGQLDKAIDILIMAKKSGVEGKFVDDGLMRFLLATGRIMEFSHYFPEKKAAAPKILEGWDNFPPPPEVSKA